MHSVVFKEILYIMHNKAISTCGDRLNQAKFFQGPSERKIRVYVVCEMLSHWYAKPSLFMNAHTQKKNYDINFFIYLILHYIVLFAL